MPRDKKTAIFDECTDINYKPVFEKAGWTVKLTTRQRRVEGRKYFLDPEIFEKSEFKHPVVTKDARMEGTVSQPFRRAGKIILKQPRKSTKEEEEYKTKVKEFASEITENDMKETIVVIPLKGKVKKIKWVS